MPEGLEDDVEDEKAPMEGGNEACPGAGAPCP